MILARDIALGVGGRTAQAARVGRGRSARRLLCGRRCANPRLHLRAGEDRPADRVIRDRESSAARAELGSDDIRAVFQTGDQTDDSPTGTLLEYAADIPPVDVDMIGVGLKYPGRSRVAAPTSASSGLFQVHATCNEPTLCASICASDEYLELPASPP